MAHAGTPTDLAKQPATSRSLWKPLLSAVVILAIGLALAMAATFLSRAGTAPAATDTSYNAIEKARGAWAAQAATVDTSDAVKAAAAAKARAMSGVPADTSYNAIENLRAQSGVTVDTSYNAVENLRAQSGVTVGASFEALTKAAAAKAQAMSGVPADPGYDRTPRGAHGQLP